MCFWTTEEWTASVATSRIPGRLRNPRTSSSLWCTCWSGCSHETCRFDRLQPNSKWHPPGYVCKVGPNYPDWHTGLARSSRITSTVVKTANAFATNHITKLRIWHRSATTPIQSCGRSRVFQPKIDQTEWTHQCHATQPPKNPCPYTKMWPMSMPTMYPHPHLPNAAIRYGGINIFSECGHSPHHVLDT